MNGFARTRNPLSEAVNKMSNKQKPTDQTIGMVGIPRLILLTGFVGRERSNLLQHFIACQAEVNRFVVVIQTNHKPNSMIPTHIVHDYVITEIDESYMKCCLIGDLKTTINEIIHLYQSDFIILENLRLEDPISLLKSVSELEDLVEFDSLTTIIDCLMAEKHLELDEIAQAQVKAADVLLLNKKDLLNEIRMQHLVQLIREFNPNAPLISITNCEFDPMIIYGVNLLKYQQPNSCDENSDMGITDQYDICDHLSVFTHNVTQSISKSGFFDLIQEQQKNIFRIEGIMEFADDNCPVRMQYVGGRYIFHKYPDPFLKDRFLIFVGKNMTDLTLPL